MPTQRSDRNPPTRSLSTAAVLLLVLLPLATAAQPVIVESGWTPLREIAFDNPISAAYNPVDGDVYVGRRGATDGLYRITAFGLVVQVSGGSNTAAICVHPDSGSIFQSEDYGGAIYRTALGATGRQTWVAGLHGGDDDPIGMAIAPADYAGDVLLPGEALVVDRGNSGADEIWLWSPLTPEGETALHVDDGTLVDAVDVAIDATGVFVVDTGGAAAGTIWSVGAGGVLTALATSEPLGDPSGIVVDPWTGDLLVLDHFDDRLVRVDRSTGQVDEVIVGIATGLGWACVDVDPDGRRLLVTDYSSDRIYEYGRCGTGPGFADCDGNGVHDGCDIAFGDLPDCNGNGVPDACDLLAGESDDCNLDGIPDECPVCPPVELVFIMDTSQSMDDEGAALCADMTAVVARLEATGIDVEARLLAICDLPGGAYACLENHVSALLGVSVPDAPPPELATLGACPGGNEVCLEDWALATAVVAGLYPWQPAGESLRLVVPLSDEGPWCGDPVTQTDRDAVDHAMLVAVGHDVVVSPITGTGSGTAVIELAQSLADATGGQRFSSTAPTFDLAESIVDIVQAACVATGDCNGNGVLDECDIAAGTSDDEDLNGIPDECDAVGAPLPDAGALRLLGCRPNPFNPSTVIEYEMSSPGSVRLEIFDLDGARVRVLVADRSRTSGRHGESWDGRDDRGRRVPAGVYVYRIRTGAETAIGRAALIK